MAQLTRHTLTLSLSLHPSISPSLEHKRKQIESEKLWDAARTEKENRPILEIIDRFVDACLCPWDDGQLVCGAREPNK